MSRFDLSGRVAVVTGGNGGIGLGMARGLAEAGAAVVIAGRNTTKSEAARAELEALGARAYTVTVDVADEASCHAMIAEAVAQAGRLDILVNNAGISIPKAPEALTLAEWHQVMNTNLTSAFTCAQAAYPHLKAAGGGKIINVGSILSVFGSGTMVAYAASKGGLMQLTKSLASGWAKDNIQVNLVLPGWVETELTRGTKESGMNTVVKMRTPARRWGTPEDLAGVTVFLASAASAYVTGASIAVDGGYSIQA